MEKPKIYPLSHLHTTIDANKFYINQNCRCINLSNPIIFDPY